MTTISEIIKEKDTVIIDVRTELEFRQEHVAGARNIPVEKIGAHVSELRKMRKPIILYCRSGARSAMALDILQRHGIDKIYDGGAIEDMKIYLN